jgi:hypothetical protein
MKRILVIAVLMVMSQTSMALDATSQALAYSAAEIIVTTAATIASSQVASLSSQMRKEEAQKIQNDIQTYTQSGAVTAFLEDKIAAVKTLDSSLSVDESVDVLIQATEIILSE